MPTSAAGSEFGRGALTPRPARRGPRRRGFTLIELLVVMAVIAIASTGLAVAMRDSADTLLDREAQRLAALLDAARAQSRASGRMVRWVPAEGGFRFEGLAPDALPTTWLDASTRAASATPLVLGPEPVIAPQQVTLLSAAQPARQVRVASDGLRPFAPAP
ncbi:MAG: type secretion system protein GspH [Pseudomonadota bacterium]|jgi:general secretion pathway protein H